MAHDHAHEGESYYMDQLCGIAAAGLLGGLAFLMWKVQLLTHFKILTPTFNGWVLAGSVLLTGLVIVRAVSLWIEVGKKKKASGHDHAHDHDHSHDHEHGHEHHHEHAHDHDHDHHDHAHDHHHHDHEQAHDHDHSHDHAHDHEHGHDHAPAHADHDHGFSPWRYAVLLLPAMLSGLLIYYYYQGLTLDYSMDRLNPHADGPALDAKQLQHKGAVKVYFQELEMARFSQGTRDFFEGRTCSLKGMLWPMNEHEFTIFRMKMACCAADAVPLKIRIISPEILAADLNKGDWVEVTGEIQFRQVPGKSEYITVMQLVDKNGVKKIEQSGQDLYDVR